jgi:hypothetical protein
MAKKREQEQQKPAEKLSRTEAANRVVQGIDGDTTLAELAEKADALYRAGRPGAEEDADTASDYVQRLLETLHEVGVVELDWHCTVHPLVQLNKNGRTNGN